MWDGMVWYDMVRDWAGWTWYGIEIFKMGCSGVGRDYVGWYGTIWDGMEWDLMIWYGIWKETAWGEADENIVCRKGDSSIQVSHIIPRTDRPLTGRTPPGGRRTPVRPLGRRP